MADQALGAYVVDEFFIGSRSRFFARALNYSVCGGGSKDSKVAVGEAWGQGQGVDAVRV